MAAIHARCFSLPPPWTAAALDALLADNLVFVLYAAAGFAVGRAAAGEAELLTLAVLPEARRCGDGRRLVAAFEAEAIRRGATEAFLEVAADNAAAQALYAACGYRKVGHRRQYYRHRGGPATDALVLRKPLTGV